MPFLFQHKCNVSDVDFVQFGVIRTPQPDGSEIQRLVCDSCREEVVVLSKGGFEQARQMTTIPGFILPGRRQ